MQLSTRRLAILLFVSGFCALIYQMTWSREFRLFFGGSTAASAAVVGVFIAGVGAGGIFLGRRVERQDRPLAFYGRLELLIALSAAITPFLLFGARYLYLSLGGTLVLGMLGGTIVRLVLSVLIIGTPAFLMGGTVPAVCRAAVTDADQSRRAVGILYGVNTLGAVAGVLVATFYLIEHFGNHVTLWLAGALNFAIGLTALRVAG